MNQRHPGRNALAAAALMIALAILSPRPGAGGAPVQRSVSPPAPDGYVADVDAWHAARVERLKNPDGYLSLAGLFPLADGNHTLGSAQSNNLQLPPQAPATAGILVVTPSEVTLQPADGSHMKISGNAVDAPVVLHSDADGSPTVVDMGDLHFYVIERPGGRLLRLKNSRNPALLAFRGVDRFPVDPEWRIVGHFEPYNPPKAIRVPSVLGSEFVSACRGAVVFSINGREYRLEPMEMDDREMFLVFGDATSGLETYGGGRFLYADVPDSTGAVVLDFNRAYNPPCAFTPYATCPLPHEQNRLGLAIRAGEKKVRGGHDHDG